MLDDVKHKKFIGLLGEQGFLTEADKMQPYLQEWRDLYQGRALAVARPNSTEMVAQTILLAKEYGLKIIPQGGNTGLVGGQVAESEQEHLILSLERMTKIREIDPISNIMIVDAGVILQNIQQAADKVDRFFPLSLASEGSCQIGGNLSTNAGGVNVLSYGNTRDLCLGLEVVLADGRIWDGLRCLKKDNTGYDLKHLFIGAEGTLGIITAAVLKLVAKPRRYETFFCALPSPDAALTLLNQCKEKFGASLTSFELISALGHELSIKHAGAKRMMTTSAPWFVLGELSLGTEAGDEADILSHLLEEALSDHFILDAVLAQSEQQRKEIWHLRESLSAAQKPEGGSIKNDISIPIALIPKFIEQAAVIVDSVVADARPVIFGHMGDGNLHYNIAQPVAMDKKDYLLNWDGMTSAIDALVIEMNGSISAEHGIGKMKKEKMRAIKSDVELELMQKIKQAIDPDHLFNPGKLLP